MAEKTRAAVYCRLAREDDDRMDAQRHKVLRYAAEQGYTDIVSYCDNGASGHDYSRRAFQKLNADISEGKISTVFAQSLERFGRNPLETERYLKAMREKGVTVETMDGYCSEPLHQVFLEIYKDTIRRAEIEEREGGADYGTEKPEEYRYRA